jgi:ankyrin repeat protein
VALLLEHGADLHATATRESWGVLHFAATVGDDAEPIISALLKAGADPQMLTANGMTPAQVAEGLGHHALVRMLGGA